MKGDVNADNSFRSLSIAEGNSIPIIFYALLIGWGLINIVQGIFTEISYDEAYYWMYSKHLDWGYFDQPPMIALFIKLGTLFFDHEIGTRIITVLAQLILLVFLWKLLEEKTPTPKKIIFFFGIAASVVMFQAFGFVATPDSPLLLFITIFLFGYQRFLKQANAGNTLLLALSMAGMAYSKYHGGLFVLLIILSNTRLVLSRRFWLASFIALLIFLPHLYWQFQNHFPSFTYHLVSRSRPFELKHVLNYWPNQLVSFNPFFLGLVLYLMFKFKPVDKFERGIYFVITGFLLFFFISSCRGNVEPHWTIAASIGMIYLVYKRGIEHQSIMKYVYRVLFPSLALILVLRVALIFPFLPVNLKFHGEKAWCAEMLSIAGDKPVVFRNSYQKPSIYSFYTGHLASSLNSIDYRKNQFDLWNFEKGLHGKEVIFVSRENDPDATPYLFPNGKKVYIHPIKQFLAANKLEVAFKQEIPGKMNVGDTIRLQVELFNPYPYSITFNDSLFPIRFHALFFRKGNERTFSVISTTPVLSVMPSGVKTPLSFQFVVPDLSPDTYKFGIVLQSGNIQESLVSSMQTVHMVDK